VRGAGRQAFDGMERSGLHFPYPKRTPRSQAWGSGAFGVTRMRPSACGGLTEPWIGVSVTVVHSYTRGRSVVAAERLSSTAVGPHCSHGLTIVDRITERRFCAAVRDRPALALPSKRLLLAVGCLLGPRHMRDEPSWQRPDEFILSLAGGGARC
jgi:hypothetical protein